MALGRSTLCHKVRTDARFQCGSVSDITTSSYFDEDTQYNVAESTKTLHLEDGEAAEDPADILWKGVRYISELATEENVF